METVPDFTALLSTCVCRGLGSLKDMMKTPMFDFFQIIYFKKKQRNIKHIFYSDELMEWKENGKDEERRVKTKR